MGRSPYQSEKRRKEIARLKKQEEKRQRRFNKKHESPEGQVEGTALEGGTEAGDHPAEDAQDGSTPAGQPVTDAPEGEKGTGSTS